MINFRYHVVSIIAVFLALAIGIVLGSTELRGALYNELNKTSISLSSDLASARTQRNTLQQEVSNDQSIMQADEARLLDGLLASQRVVLVNAPGAPSPVINGLASALRAAGAALTGQVNLQPKMLDASANNQQFLGTLAQGLESTSATQANGTGLEQAAKLLGSAILTKNGTSAGPSGSSSGSTSGNAAGTSPQDILNSYQQAGLLAYTGQPYVPATLAIVVTSASPPAGGDAAPANQGLITLAQQLSTAGLGTVMAGSAAGSGPGSAIDALHASTSAGQISSVDYADSVSGQVVTVQALNWALAGRKANSYGWLSGDNQAAPSPGPTPSGSATPDPGSQGKNAKTTAAGKNRAGSSSRARS